MLGAPGAMAVSRAGPLHTSPHPQRLHCRQHSVGMPYAQRTRRRLVYVASAADGGGSGGAAGPDGGRRNFWSSLGATAQSLWGSLTQRDADQPVMQQPEQPAAVQPPLQEQAPPAASGSVQSDGNSQLLTFQSTGGADSCSTNVPEAEAPAAAAAATPAEAAPAAMPAAAAAAAAAPPLSPPPPPAPTVAPPRPSSPGADLLQSWDGRDAPPPEAGPGPSGWAPEPETTRSPEPWLRASVGACVGTGWVGGRVFEPGAACAWRRRDPWHGSPSHMCSCPPPPA